MRWQGVASDVAWTIYHVDDSESDSDDRAQSPGNLSPMCLAHITFCCSFYSPAKQRNVFNAIVTLYCSDVKYLA